MTNQHARGKSSALRAIDRQQADEAERSVARNRRQYAPNTLTSAAAATTLPATVDGQPGEVVLLRGGSDGLSASRRVLIATPTLGAPVTYAAGF